MKAMKIVSLAVVVLALAGCKSAADRMYECEAQGISRDACYTAEQNRQATLNGAAQKQAYENAQAAVSDDSSRKHHHHKGY